ncbi:hypothetical protein SORBI_3002G215932 [Sorghum bicolor]|uniref:Uncharacterized protein n=1 Tax=Sorghum bicolor TaxID=4558 RepID=A0A1W0W5A0_SORBI|nr:hypothetical protein SORBI_3002G215932 [Sorghum bicolor]
MPPLSWAEHRVEPRFLAWRWRLHGFGCQSRRDLTHFLSLTLMMPVLGIVVMASWNILVSRSHCCMRHRWSTYHRATIIYQGFENPSGDRLNSGLHLESLKQFFYLVLSSLYTDAKTFWP